MSAPEVKGWCPGAYKPMQSGDGLVVRVRPMAAQISAAQATGLAQAAQAHGNGFIDLTNRANLQIRGVSTDSYPALMADLDSMGYKRVILKSDQEPSSLLLVGLSGMVGMVRLCLKSLRRARARVMERLTAQFSL